MFLFASFAPALQNNIQVGDILYFRFPFKKPSGLADLPEKRPGFLLAFH
tara:strand:- start:91 stop:237 length:147 start_codon:yes stop_codon:yes gene_type:complete